MWLLENSRGKLRLKNERNLDEMQKKNLINLHSFTGDRLATSLTTDCNRKTRFVFIPAFLSLPEYWVTLRLNHVMKSFFTASAKSKADEILKVGLHYIRNRQWYFYNFWFSVADHCNFIAHGPNQSRDSNTLQRWHHQGPCHWRLFQSRWPYIETTDRFVGLRIHRWDSSR